MHRDIHAYNHIYKFQLQKKLDNKCIKCLEIHPGHCVKVGGRKQ